MKSENWKAQCKNECILFVIPWRGDLCAADYKNTIKYRELHAIESKIVIDYTICDVRCIWKTLKISTSISFHSLCTFTDELHFSSLRWVIRRFPEREKKSEFEIWRRRHDCISLSKNLNFDCLLIIRDTNYEQTTPTIRFAAFRGNFIQSLCTATE